jgi:hypothetical protein
MPAIVREPYVDVRLGLDDESMIDALARSAHDLPAVTLAD